MRKQIRKAENHYYAISIDKDNNETILGENKDLKELKLELKLPDDVEVVDEAEVRGSVIYEDEAA